MGSCQGSQKTVVATGGAGGGGGGGGANPPADSTVKCGSHLESYQSLTGFPVFPEGTKSSVARFNTKEIWDKYHDKNDKFGVSYKLCIFSGCKNVDSGIGVYAGSHDSYKTFAPLFDKVIEDYHGHKPGDKHVSDMDASKLDCPPLPEDEAAMIVSTRIRVGRNLEGYPLGPGVSKEQRDEIMQKVVKACETFEGDLKGTFYPLEGMDKTTQDQLIADHFLFKEGDRFLEACGCNRDWPSGRGIFHNAEKTFLVWVNEEDQLRIISMQKGADIGAVFERLSRAAAHIETVAKFSHDDCLGYITSCPTNLGTALRASVHIKLPKLSSRKKEFQAIADKYYVQIRGIHGEHSESSDGTYDISNKRRLGRSEVQLVQDMYNGVKAMIKREKELTEGLECGLHLENPESLTAFPILPDGTKSSVARFNTKEIWDQFHDKKDKFGVSYKLCIFSGCKNVDSGIGVYAGSHDSYKTFAPLFDKVIEDYHGHKPGDKHVSDMDASKLDCPPLPEDEAAMIVSTRIRVGRNLEGYPLGPGVSKEERDKIMQKVVQACETFEGDLKGTFYPLEGMDKSTQDQLIADHFLFKEGDRFLEACGCNRDWPSGRGIFHNAEKMFLVWVNEEDQLRIISMQKGADIRAVFERLSRAAAHIETVAKFSHDDCLGYITSCPTNLGTALRASVHIKLPKLSALKDEFQAIADKYYVQIRGIHGEHSESSDGTYDISNKRRLGRSEVQLVQDMYNGVKAMIKREKELSNVDSVKCGPHLESPESLTKFPLFPEGTKSSVARFNTQEIWNKFHDKNDRFGVSYKLCIFSGCKNVDSGIGVYAGSHDSYKTFAPLFDKVIEDYHGHKPGDKHVSDMDASKLDCPPIPEDEAAMIVSTRIRVGRNLEGYPLGPGVSKEERDEIMQKVVKACETFEGDLKGTFYPLEGMDKTTQDQLIADHFLFKEGDRFLEACGCNRDWPSGRGIFHNAEKTFLVWVNEEDQLRIISMQKGADIGAVFERLSQAAAHIETVAKFSHDDCLGYITSCPTNLGTALRASVHIKLPKLSSRKKEFQAIADKYYVQIRGIHGEHSESSDGTYDISNKRRLGRSEVQLVQDMYNGVKAMIKREKELTEGLECGSHLENPESLTAFPILPDGTKSSVARFNTKEIWDQFHDKKDKFGVSYKLCIFSGCKNVDSGIGVYAGSHDSYKTFAPLFDKVIEDYHGHKPGDKHISDMDASKLDCPPLPEDEAAMIVSTRIRVGRNLEGYPLGPGVSKEQRDDIMQKVVKACETFEGDLKGTFYSLEGMDKTTQDQLIADHFLFKEGDRFLEACGCNRDWPSGRGIFHNAEKTFLVWVNEEDQLRIISMQKGADIGAVFERLSRAAAHIETVAKFSHDDCLGYITSCPTNLGTALRASVHIKLPKLSALKDEFQAIADKYYVQIRGIHGEHSESSDGTYDISNKRRLGRSEVQLVQDMYNGVKAMIKREKEL